MGVSTSRKIFVLGSGRSGTHWLGYTLDGHPAIEATIEKPAIFRRVTNVALNPRRRPVVLPYLLWAYRREHRRVAPRHYADKSHPNLWIAETLARWFPTALFVGVERSVYGTIASMLVHKGILVHQEQWRRYPVPNRFLGITKEIAPFYDALPVVAQCALRWRAHHEEMERVAERLGPRMLVLSYESMIDQYEEQCSTLWSFLDVDDIGGTAPPKSTSRDQWRDQLSADDLTVIKAYTGVSPDSALV
jgi:hypothetical protein